MNIKLLTILFFVVVTGFGYSLCIIGGGRYNCGSSPLQTTVSIITALLLTTILIGYWLMNRSKESPLLIIFKILGSLIPVAAFIGLFLLVLYRIQFAMTQGETLGGAGIRIFGQYLQTEAFAAVFIFFLLVSSISYLAVKDYFSAVNKNSAVKFLRLFLKSIVLSLISGILVGFTVAYGVHGESGLIGLVIPIVYLIGGLVVSVIASSIASVQSKRRLG